LKKGKKRAMLWGSLSTVNIFFIYPKNGEESLLESKMKANDMILKIIKVYFPHAELGFCVPKMSKIYYIGGEIYFSQNGSCRVKKYPSFA
jgi:hypothetical protein